MEAPSKRLFTNKQLISLMIPIVMGSVMNSLVAMVDSVMVSAVGEAAISAVSLVGTLMGVVWCLFSALSVGGSVLTSQYIGANKFREAKHSTGQLILMSVSVSTMFGVVCSLFAKPLLQLCFGSIEDAVMDNALTYFYYVVPAYPVIGLGSSTGTIFHCARNTKITLKIGVLTNIVNIIGNYICIYKLHMGVEGVAIPTLISHYVSAGVTALALYKSKQDLKPKWKDIVHIDTKMIGKMLRLGMPTALENSLFEVGKVMIMSMVTMFGTYQVAANSTACTLLNYPNLFAHACNSVSLMVVGQCVGAGDMKQLKENVRKLLIISYVFGNILAIVMILIRRQLLGLYVTLSPETVELAAKLMLIHLVPMLFIYPTAFFLNGPLRAVNDGVFTMFVSMGSMLILRVALARILCVELEWGAIGTWTAMICDWLCRSIFFVTRYKSGKWKKNCRLV